MHGSGQQRQEAALKRLLSLSAFGLVFRHLHLGMAKHAVRLSFSFRLVRTVLHTAYAGPNTVSSFPSSILEAYFAQAFSGSTVIPKRSFLLAVCGSFYMPYRACFVITVCIGMVCFGLFWVVIRRIEVPRLGRSNPDWVMRKEEEVDSVFLHEMYHRLAMVLR